MDLGLLGTSLSRFAAGAGELAAHELRESQEVSVASAAAGVATVVVVEAPPQGAGTLLLGG